MPFHNTWVCEEEVPRRDTVDSDALPDCLMNSDELYARSPAIDADMSLFSALLSISVRTGPPMRVLYPETVASARVSVSCTAVPGGCTGMMDMAMAARMLQVTSFSFQYRLSISVFNTSRMPWGLSLP